MLRLIVILGVCVFMRSLGWGVELLVVHMLSANSDCLTP